jgi:L-alanine-DL-glutamate epimerase-like enolase superfamily enzyme
MKITELQLFYINRGRRASFGTGWNVNYLLVKVYTDEGIYGVGEAFHTGKDKATEGALSEYARWLVGKDSTRIPHNWYAYFRGARYPLGTATTAALSAVEHALWDISGKACGVPVYRMLGDAFREKIRVYGSTYLIHPANFEEGDLKAFGDACAMAREKGFTAIKITPQPPN